MNPLISTLIALAGLTGASSSATQAPQSYNGPSVQVVQSAQRPQNVQVNAPAVSSAVVMTGDLTGDLFLPEQTQQNVLVIPTPGLPDESLADLTEDLSIMCRILDKALPSTRSSVGVAYGDQADPFRWVASQQGRGTQGLYLDGYGALFFIPVNYPLAPTEKQEATPAKAKEPVDSVWSETIKEMSGQPTDAPQTARNVPAYDAQRVDTLAKTLIKSLTHAANIRMRRPQDTITLVVGALDDNRLAAYYGRVRSSGTNRSRLLPGAAAGPAQPAARNPMAALLVLRVGKADVDAVAKGQLTPAQFADKVQALWSWIGPSVPPAAAGRVSTSASSRAEPY